MKRYNRRQLIGYAALATATTLLNTCRASSRGSAPASNQPILVIGAGVAGLAAAQHLHQQGYQVLVLEGRDRLGGRIWTDTSLGLPLDLGASWIHRSTGNPITQLAQQLGIQTVPTDYEAQQVYAAPGQPLSEADNAAITREYNFLEQAFTRWKSNPNTTDRTSLAEVVEQVIQERRLTGKILRGVNWQLASNIEIDHGANLSELALLPYNEDTEFQGNDVVFPQGYRQLIQGLARNLEIQLNQIVRRIEYTDTGVTVTTNRGSFTGNRAIITLPLGVLKQGKVQFSPELPQEKVAAVQRLAMGTLNKVALRFPKQFWPQEIQTLGYLKDQREQVMEYWNWSHYVQAPILVALAGGQQARSFGQTPTAEVVARVMADLRAMFGSKIPNPVQSTVTQWHRDPFALGAYSIRPPSSSLEDIDCLAAPVGDRLLFAGEATNSSYPSTVHGAFLSGEREAKRIMELDET